MPRRIRCTIYLLCDIQFHLDQPCFSCTDSLWNCLPCISLPCISSCTPSGIFVFVHHMCRTCQMRRLFAKFDEHRELWAKAVRCLAHLDALLSLADVSAQPGHCRPQFYDGKKTASFIRLQNARHPCLAQTYQGGEYIPNNATLGPAPPGITGGAQDAPKMLLLTGPNMGGKSTLLRQTCLVAVLSQVRIFAKGDYGTPAVRSL